MTLYEETLCEHGYMKDHHLPPGATRFCFGGIREEVTREAIPWCTTHDSKRLGHNPELCEFAAWYSNQDKHQIGGQNCVISTGGPDHKWWKTT